MVYKYTQGSSAPVMLKKTPRIYYNSIGLPCYMGCSDYTYHDLTLLDAILFKAGFTDVNSLDEKYREDKDTRPGG